MDEPLLDPVEVDAPDIAALFGGNISNEHRIHVTDWWAEVMGGPARSDEKRGGSGRGTAATGICRSPNSDWRS